jgi:hypothetical protein
LSGLAQQALVSGLPGLPGLPGRPALLVPALLGRPGLELGRPVPALLRGYSLVGLGVALFISSLSFLFLLAPTTYHLHEFPQFSIIVGAALALRQLH